MDLEQVEAKQPNGMEQEQQVVDEAASDQEQEQEIDFKPDEIVEKIQEDDYGNGLVGGGECSAPSHINIKEQAVMSAPTTTNIEDMPLLSQAWTFLHPQFSQTKVLPFSAGQKATDFWHSLIANNAQDVFKVLLPKKIVLGVCAQLNVQLKKQFAGQIDEKQLKKKLYKTDQIYEYFGVKILMGYCRMPDPEDYFSQSLPFRNRIGELIKEGRFKCVESWTSFSDEMLSSLKASSSITTKSEYKENHTILHNEIIPKIMKKVNKLQRRACNANQMLSLVRDQYFEGQDVASGDAISCIYMQDVDTNFILSMTFQPQSTQDAAIIRMLESHKHRNHKVYLQRNLLSLEQINYLALRQGVYCHGIVRQPPKEHEIVFSKAELMTNGTLMILMLKQKELLEVSSADGYHRYSSTDRRCYASVTLQDITKKAEQFAHLSEQFKCQFSCVNLSGTLFTAVLEMVIWNSYVVYKNILKKHESIEFADFRLMLAKQLLAAKMKIIEQNPLPTLPLQHPKTNTVAVQTEKLSSYSSFQPKAPISVFHIPTMLVTSTSLQVTLQCVVCRKAHTQLTQCVNCSEVSGKLVALCPTECFTHFHQAPTDYIGNADDIPSTQKSSQQGDPSNTPSMAKSNKYQSYQPPTKLSEPYDVSYVNRQPADDDLWDDGLMRRRQGRPVGAHNRRKVLYDGTGGQPSQTPPVPDFNLQEESMLLASINPQKLMIGSTRFLNQ